MNQTTVPKHDHKGHDHWWTYHAIAVAMLLGIIAFGQNVHDVERTSAYADAQIAATTAVENERTRVGYSIDEQGNLRATPGGQLERLVKNTVTQNIPASYSADQIKCIVHTLYVNESSGTNLDHATCVRPR